jgi:hypothetical protein
VAEIGMRQYISRDRAFAEACGVDNAPSFAMSSVKSRRLIRSTSSCSTTAIDLKPVSRRRATCTCGQCVHREELLGAEPCVYSGSDERNRRPIPPPRSQTSTAA